MASKATMALLLSSFLCSTSQARNLVSLDHLHAPINNAIPTVDRNAPDPSHWTPIATLAPATSIPSATPAPSSDTSHVPIIDSFLHELRKRQGAPVAAPAPAATAGGQVSPVTTYMVQSKGVQVPVVYTQTFPPIPEQWPSPVAGTIGLGTIQGTVGGIRSKRAEPTQMPIMKEEEGESELEKLIRILPVDEDRGSGEEKLRVLEDVMYSDARRAVQAGTLAVLAVSIGTVCISYL